MLNSGAGHRWWEVEQSPQDGPQKLSQALGHCEKALGRCESFLGALSEGLFYLPPPSACTTVYTNFGTAVLMG